MSGGMTGSRKKPDIVREHGVYLYQFCSSQFDERRRAVDPNPPGQLPALFHLLLPILVFCATHVVSGLREGRHPSTVHQSRIPAAMIYVQVSVDDDIHLFK